MFLQKKIFSFHNPALRVKCEIARFFSLYFFAGLPTEGNVQAIHGLTGHGIVCVGNAD